MTCTRAPWRMWPWFLLHFLHHLCPLTQQVLGPRPPDTCVPSSAGHLHQNNLRTLCSQSPLSLLLPDSDSTSVPLLTKDLLFCLDGILSLLKAMHPPAVSSWAAGAAASILGYPDWAGAEPGPGHQTTSTQRALTCWISVSTIL